MIVPRRTLEAPVRVEGVGLFTGTESAITIEPNPEAASEAGTPPGIVFIQNGVPIRAEIANLSTTPAHPAFAQMPARNTGLQAGKAGPGAAVHTVEHLLATFAGLGITDAIVRMEGAEIPIGDGSAALFVRPILDIGTRPLEADPIEPARVRAPIRVERDGASVTIEPSDRPEFVYRLEYGVGSPIPSGEAAWDGDPGSFAAETAPARTFCLRAEAEAMHAMGLFAHLTPEDMLVFGPEGPIDNTLRFPDEPARHKLLDLIGDLSLVGRPFCARVIAERSGHALNHEAARKLVALLDA